MRVKDPFELLHPFAVDEINLVGERSNGRVIHTAETYLGARVDSGRRQHCLSLLMALSIALLHLTNE